MLLSNFLAKNYEFAQEPHLYCVLQQPQTLTNPAYRCGAAGTQLFKDADLPFKSSDSSQKGLAGRMTQYNNYWLPNNGRIFACLRVKKQLVALPHQRTAGEDGEQYNVDRGNQTEVLARESHYHHYLDEAGLRWQKDRNNELFQPTRGPLQIVESLRRVKGLQLILFDEDDWRDDPLYDGGDVKEPKNLKVRDTNQRKTPARSSTDPSLVIRMSKSGIEQLRAGNQQAYARLMNLMREAYKEDVEPTTTPRTTVRLATKVRRNLQSVDPVVRAVAASQLAAAALSFSSFPKVFCRRRPLQCPASLQKNWVPRGREREISQHSAMQTRLLYSKPQQCGGGGDASCYGGGQHSFGLCVTHRPAAVATVPVLVGGVELGGCAARFLLYRLVVPCVNVNRIPAARPRLRRRCWQRARSGPTTLQPDPCDRLPDSLPVSYVFRLYIVLILSSFGVNISRKRRWRFCISTTYF